MIKVITSSSRPLIGVLLSQSTEDLRYKAEISSRPLISIEAGADTDNSVVFSSPYRGSLISMYWCMSDEIGHEGSRPLIGVLLSQYCPLHLLKHRAFIPHLRGKPANERNLNIKLVYNIHKA